jgi:beta-lactamase class A
LQTILNHAVSQTLVDFAGLNLTPDELAVTLVDLRDPDRPVWANYRGGVLIYPASVIKLFYLQAAHAWLERGQLADTEELRRALHDMIVYSYNEATGYVIDLLTGTTSGPELPPEELAVWHDRRNAVNRYFAALGYTDINVNKKPWCEGPYGRETQAIAAYAPQRNWLTTDAAARIMVEIATGRAVTPERSRQMLALLQRDFAHTPGPDPVLAASGHENQATDFTARGLPPDARLWSKAGYTSATRHDAAYIELPAGPRFVLVTFTVNHANEKAIIPTLARLITQSLSALP